MLSIHASSMGNGGGEGGGNRLNSCLVAAVEFPQVLASVKLI